MDTSRHYNQFYLSQRTLQTFIYHVPPHKSPKFKVTCHTAVNKTVVSELIDGEESVDEIDFSQIVKYNLRIRWRFESWDYVFIGAETMSKENSTQKLSGLMKNTFYIGFKKVF